MTDWVDDFVSKLSDDQRKANAARAHALLSDRLITERALLQYAKETGIRVDDTTVERTILRIAQENKLSPEEFRKVLDREGIAYRKYHEDIRRELVIQRVRDREVDSKIFVSDAEVDNYLATVSVQAGGETEYLVSHILVRVPEQSSPEQIAQRLARAQEALAKIRAGEDFAQVAATWSDATDAQQGGNLGWRTPARMPSIFVEAVRSLKKGEVSEPLRSPAGFHLVKMMDERSRNAPTVVQQTRVRHILIKVNELTSDVDGRDHLSGHRIECGDRPAGVIERPDLLPFLKVANTVRVGAGHHRAQRLQRFQIDDGRRVPATVAREPAPEIGRNSESMHAGCIGNLAYDLAGLGISDDDLRRV